MKCLIASLSAVVFVSCAPASNNPNSDSGVVFSTSVNDQVICNYTYFLSTDKKPHVVGGSSKELFLDNYDKYRTSQQVFSFEDDLSIIDIFIETDRQTGSLKDPTHNIGKSVRFEIIHRNKAIQNVESYMSANAKMGFNVFKVYIGSEQLNGEAVDTISISCGFFNK